ncbi:MAG TPA: HlyD family secretion protein [Chroococcales cyanobacterium]
MENSEPENPRRRPPLVLIGVLGVALLGGGIVGGRWWLHQQAFVSTEDAQVAGNLVTVSARISGRIDRLLVDEGQLVKAGQAVAFLDRSDLQAQLAQAQAALAVAQSGLKTSATGVSLQSDQTNTTILQADAQLKSARAGLNSAEANAEKSAVDLFRLRRLYEAGAVSKQSFDAARAASTSAESVLSSAKNQVSVAEAALSMARSGSQAVDIKRGSVKTVEAQIKQARAFVDMAELQLSHSSITAPVAGTVARRMVNPGEQVSPGQGLFSVSEAGNIWISAFVEETKIRRVKKGAPVEIKVDAFPDKLFHGTVSQVGAATGGQFSLLPANNAAGNFTKVVQRIPVKILVPSNAELKPGMSAVIDIATRG